jgi:outer membrane protein OmpA-like peptidoglycan-associated protein
MNLLARLLPLLFLGFIVPLSLLAQVPAADADCRDRIHYYQVLSQDEKTAYQGKLGLAIAYSEADCPAFQPEEAFRLLVDVNQWYRSLDRKSKERAERRGYDRRAFSRTREAVLQHFYQQALSSRQPEAIDAFLQQREALIRRSFRAEAEKERNRLAFQQAREQNTLAAWIELAERYGTSLQSNNHELRDSLAHLQLAAWTAEKGWAQWEAMQQTFPRNPFPADRGRDPFMQIRNSGSPAAFQRVADRYQSSPWGVLAQDSAATIQARIQAFRLAIEQAFTTLYDSSAVQEWPAADAQLQGWLVQGRLNTETLAQALQSIPGRRIPQTQDELLGRFLVEETEAEVRLFQRQFPNYYAPQRLDSLIEDFTTRDARLFQAELDQLVDRLQDPGQAQFWPSADQRLVALLEQAEGEQYEILTRTVQEIPYERIRATLTYLYNSYLETDETEGDAQFLADFPVREYEYAAIQQSQLGNQRRLYHQLQRQLAPSIEQRNWEACIATANTWGDRLEDYPAYQELLDILSRPEPPATLDLLGGTSVNTSLDEYSPVLTADGQRLYFCRLGKSIFSIEEIFWATQINGSWLAQGEVRSFADSKDNMAPLSLTVDGNRLLIFQEGTMLYTDRQQNGWSEPTPFPDAINGGPWQGMGTLSPDGRVMIFETKERADMIGPSNETNLDLFISFQDEQGRWQKAQNLGRILNTPGTERSPFLHPDTRTLYFSSNGRGGLGGMDVYKTTRLDESWLHWSAPVHLGRQANSAGDDWGYKISTDGSFAYFSADPDGDRKDDIYQIELAPQARPEPVTLLKTRLLRPDGTLLEGEVQIEDAETGEIVARLRTEPGTGIVTAALPNGRAYVLTFDHGERLPFLENLDLREVEKTQILENDITLKTTEEAIATGESFTLRNLFFDHDQATLRVESEPELQRAVNILRRYPNLQVVVEGHTDSDGNDDYNRDLSQRRAATVRQALIARGIPANRLSSAGYGEVVR